MTHDSTPAAGIDAAKDKLDIAIAGSTERFTVVNAAPGWRQLAARLAAAGVRRAGVEASGGYERGAVDHLRAAGITVLVLQPLQVKAYARLHLRRAKNDRIRACPRAGRRPDPWATLIATCAALLDPPAGKPDARLAALADHLTFIEQIEEDIARLKTRLEHLRPPRLRRLAASEIARLQRRREAALRRLRLAVATHDDLKTRFDLVLSVPGIGERTALAMLIRLPELGTLSREQAAALAGLAPFDDDSGTQRGQRRIAGGRARLRRSLYAAALPAAFRWNPALVALYRRLKEAANPTNPPSSPAPASCSSTPIPSSPAAPLGRHIQPRVNGCYAPKRRSKSKS